MNRIFLAALLFLAAPVPIAVASPALQGLTTEQIKGYNWAQTQKITDASKCNGQSQAFDEGCIARVLEIAGGTVDRVVDDYTGLSPRAGQAAYRFNE